MRGFLKAILALFLAVVSTTFPNPRDLEEARNTYCRVPPFIQQEVFANLMLVIDTSGSMKADAYRGSYSSQRLYKGIFDPDAYYACYVVRIGGYYRDTDSCNSNRSDKYWVKLKDDVCKASSSSPCPKRKTFRLGRGNIKARSGNWLNYEYMKRIDVIRWVLTGGRTKRIRGTEVVVFYYGQAVKATDTTSYNPETKQVEGVLQKVSRNSKRPRIGAYFYRGYRRPYIKDKVAPSFDYTDLINKVNSVTASSTTPTRYALEDTLRYFSLKNGRYGGFSINSSNNPYKFKINGRTVTIRCARNYVLLMTDGEWNTGGEPLGYAYDMWKGGSADLVASLDGNQNAKIYSVALFLNDGRGKNAVKHFAIFGGFEDIDNNRMPCGYSSFPSSSFNNIVDITKPRYSRCRNEWDADKDTLPDTFADGSDPEKVKEAIDKIFEKILEDISSGTSVSVLSEKDSKGAMLVQSIFSPQRYVNGYRINWSGQLYSYWFLNIGKAQNIREDTNKDKKLNILQDNILKFRTDTSGRLAIDVFSSKADGSPDSKVNTYFSLDDINYLWEAGEELKNTEANDRRLFTVSTSGSLVEFKLSKLSAFRSKLGTDADHFPECLRNGSGIDYEKLVKYVRGEDIPGCRSRRVNNTGNNAGDIWKLGDIIYSTPKIVDYGDYSVVYTASNDGILHAFYAGKLKRLNSGNDIAELEGRDLGYEIWGFIPSSALTFLRYLADPKYCHMYLHDLSPFILKADYNKDGREEIVLIGGLRFGGSCDCAGTYCVKPPSDNNTAFSQYYALDVTDPANPKLLWEFKHPYLGFSYSGPGVIKTKNGEHYVVFASGPTSYTAQYDNTVNSTLRIFVVNLREGVLERIIDTGIRKAFGGRIFSQGFDLNENGYTDFIVFGYTRQDGSDKNYKGGVIFLAGDVQGNKLYPIERFPSVSSWETKNFTALGTDIPPVTAKVEAGKCFDKWYMFLGSGRWFDKNDDWEVINNVLFGIPLQPYNSDGSSTWDYSNYDYIKVLTNTADVTNVNNTRNICTDYQNGVVRGWYLRLDGASGNFLKEKAISNPSVTDKNVVFFPTIFPSNDYCDYGGNTRVWVLNCATGDAVFSKRCPQYTVDVKQFNYLLQLSGGDIQEIQSGSLNSENGRATQKISGIASEEGGVPLFPTLGRKGRILLWIEK